MAWSSAQTEWIIDSQVVRAIYMYMSADDKTYKRKRTTTTRHAPAMTYDAAESVAASEKSAYPGADVIVERQNDAGAYLVRFSLTTWTAWTEVT